MESHTSNAEMIPMNTPENDTVVEIPTRNSPPGGSDSVRVISTVAESSTLRVTAEIHNRIHCPLTSNAEMIPMNTPENDTVVEIPTRNSPPGGSDSVRVISTVAESSTLRATAEIHNRIHCPLMNTNQDNPSPSRKSSRDSEAVISQETSDAATKTTSENQTTPASNETEAKKQQGEQAEKEQGDRGSTEKHIASRKAVVTKWFTSAIIGLLFLACLVHSKISLLSLSEALHAANTLNLLPRSRIFAMLQFVALVPHAINLVRGIWCGLLRKDRNCSLQRDRWIVATVISLLESFGLCLFIFCIPGLCKPRETVLLMNWVFVFPLCVNLFCLPKNNGNENESKSNDSTQNSNEDEKKPTDSTQKSNEDKKKPTKKKLNQLRQNLIIISWVIAVIVELFGIAVSCYLLRNLPLNKIWIVPTGVICLSISWIPSIQKYLVQKQTTQKETNRHYQCYAAMEALAQFLTRRGVEREVMNRMSEEKQGTPSKLNQPIERATWKITAWMSFVKLLSTAGFSMIIYFNGTLSPFTDGLGTGYLLGYIACTTRSQKLGFSVPLLLATPCCVIILTIYDTCKDLLLYPGVTEGTHECSITEHDIIAIACATFLLVAAKVLSTWLVLHNSQLVAMLGEGQLFWTPMYNSALLEHWIMLSRRNKYTDKDNLDLNPSKKAVNTKLFICTTMYRESKQEMKQFLKSLRGIKDRVASSEGLQFESHIFVDGAISEGILNEFAVQLQTLVNKIVQSPSTEMKTPYGRSQSWKLETKEKMSLTIHLKDESKVKKGKRWSQIMYMSYVLDRSPADVKKSYILTTDGDVKFTTDNVEALLDIMIIENDVGAVCCRTHPLGSGPVVWYQKFDYAIGHWFQKAAEHVIGSVLCSPGCFSVYRCEAIADVLEKYATNVEKAEDFLTKDMGEDRWFSTLMVKSGWRIKYCAASENKTHCPEDFDEFFKQRRRWIASTLANLWLLIEKWEKVQKKNPHLSFLFLIYQVILLLATIIGPSSIILVVSGGLKYGANWNTVATIALQVVLCVFFTIICLYRPQKQLFVAKCLTGFYAVLMTIAIVGTAVEIASDFNGEPESEHNFISDNIRISTASTYLFSMTGIFVAASILHLREITCLLHGFFYLLFLPSGYIILIIYSICNLTDSSWGTRESNNQEKDAEGKTMPQMFKELIQYCCCSGNVKQDDYKVLIEAETRQEPSTRSKQTRTEEEDNSPEQPVNNEKWDTLMKKYNLGLNSADSTSDDNKPLSARLADLRNRWVVAFGMINSLWLILISTLAYKGDILGVFGSNPVGFLVIVLFGFVLIIQFFAMIIHRIYTFMHFLGRTPYKFNSPYNGNWMFPASQPKPGQESDRRSRTRVV